MQLVLRNPLRVPLELSDLRLQYSFSAREGERIDTESAVTAHTLSRCTLEETATQEVRPGGRSRQTGQTDTTVCYADSSVWRGVTDADLQRHISVTCSVSVHTAVAGLTKLLNHW